MYISLPYAILSKWLIITEFLALKFCMFCCVAATKAGLATTAPGPVFVN